MPRSKGPFEVLERVNDNVDKIDLPGDYNVSAAFNLSDMSPYLYDTYQVDLRTNLLTKGEDDRGPSHKFLIDSSCKKLQVKVQEKSLCFTSLHTHILVRRRMQARFYVSPQLGQKLAYI